MGSICLVHSQFLLISIQMDQSQQSTIRHNANKGRAMCDERREKMHWDFGAQCVWSQNSVWQGSMWSCGSDAGHPQKWQIWKISCICWLVTGSMLHGWLLNASHPIMHVSKRCLSHTQFFSILEGIFQWQISSVMSCPITVLIQFCLGHFLKTKKQNGCLTHGSNNTMSAWKIVHILTKCEMAMHSLRVQIPWFVTSSFISKEFSGCLFCKNKNIQPVLIPWIVFLRHFAHNFNPFFIVWHCAIISACLFPWVLVNLQFFGFGWVPFISNTKTLQAFFGWVPSVSKTKTLWNKQSKLKSFFHCLVDFNKLRWNAKRNPFSDFSDACFSDWQNPHNDQILGLWALLVHVTIKTLIFCEWQRKSEATKRYGNEWITLNLSIHREIERNRERDRERKRD